MLRKVFLRPVMAGCGTLLALVLTIGANSEALASCGSAACFMITGDEASVQQKGELSVDFRYAYTISKLDTGVSGRVAAVDQEAHRIVLNEHKEQRTISETEILDINYGLTDRVTLEVTVPYRRVNHTHFIEVGNANGGSGTFEKFQEAGVGDVRLTAKYSMLPTLRNLVVTGLGVDLPTGNSSAKNINGILQEPTLQIGRRAYGIYASMYQSYEVVPHRLNEFTSASYHHSFLNPNNYQFGDEYVLSAGMNLRMLEVVTLTGQFNWRYAVHDEFKGSTLESALFLGDPGFPGDSVVVDPDPKRRPVPNTGSTMLAFSPGVSVQVRDNLRAYFFAQIPVARDFNGGLIPDVSYLTGLSMSF